MDEREPFAAGPWWKNVLLIAGAIALIVWMTVVSRSHQYKVLHGNDSAITTVSQSSNSSK